MVKMNDNLVRLGGSKVIFDHLNAGPAHDYIKSAKILHRDNTTFELEEDFQGICGTSFTGYMHHCLVLAGPDATTEQIEADNVTDFMILSVGGLWLLLLFTFILK